MPIPFDMIVVMLFLGYYMEQTETSPPPLAWSATIMLASLAALILVGAVLNRLALTFIRRKSIRFAERSIVASSSDVAIRAALTLFFIFGLIESSFPWSLAKSLAWEKHDAIVPQTTAILTFFIFFICAWLPLFSLHREVTRGRWTRKTFILHKARYNLFILIAWIPFAIFSDWLADALIFLPFIFVAVAWTFPALLAKVWGCKPFPPGPVPDLVHDLEKQSGVSFSKILLWEPGGGTIQNAAAVGLFKPFRYLLLTPALVNNLNSEELAGVVLHELGHVKKRHLLLYMFTTLTGVNLAVMGSQLIPLSSEIEQFSIMSILVIVYFRFIFGWLSRNMERQADLFSLEITGKASGLVNALEKLGISAGNIRLARSWHHIGIAERTHFLRRAEAAPGIARRHNAKAGKMMLAGYSLSIILLVGLGFAAGEQLSGQHGLFPENNIEVLTHWRRVMLLQPGSAVGPLELAYRLAADPKMRDEAARLAAMAMSLSSQREEREAAEKLIRELAEGMP